MPAQRLLPALVPEHGGGRTGLCVVADDDLVAGEAMMVRLVDIGAGGRTHAERVALSLARGDSLQKKGTRSAMV